MPKKETTVNKRVGKEKKSVESKELESKSHSNTKSYKKATYPDWVQEMAWTFCDEYGVKKGSKIVNRVLTHVLTGFETIH